MLQFLKHIFHTLPLCRGSRRGSCLLLCCLLLAGLTGCEPAVKMAGEYSYKLSGKVTIDRLYFVQRLRSLVTDIFQTPLYFWVHSESFDIFYFRRRKAEKGFQRYVP